MGICLLLVLFFVLSFVQLQAQSLPEKHSVCLQLSMSSMRAGIANSSSTRSYLFPELSMLKREQHSNVFNQYGLSFMNGLFNDDGPPTHDSLMIYRSLGPVLGAGYSAEDSKFGFDFSAALALPLQRSEVKDPAFNFSLKVFLNVSYHGQFFVRFSNINTISDHPQAIRQGGFGLQVLID